MDVWTIDVNPIDWTNTPNEDPGKLASYEGQNVLHSYIAVQQLQGMRQYLDGIGYAATPIWITQIAIQVGYDSYAFDPFPTTIVPVGDYHWDLMSNYVNSVLDWLEANAATHKIERWFFYTTWADIVNVGADGYMGVILFDGPQQGASLNCLGEVYRARSLALPRLACDPDGNAIPPVEPTPTPTSVPSLTPLGLVAVGGALALLILAYTSRRSATSSPAAASRID